MSNMPGGPDLRFALMILMLAPLPLMEARATAPRLEAPAPLDLRGVPLGEALDELSRRIGVTYLLDDLVEPGDLAAPVRLSARHLNGAQAFRWLARSGGLEAAWREDLFYVGRPDRLPVSSEPDLQDMKEAQAAGIIGDCRMDAGWADVPLARVADDISSACGIDVVFHREILEASPLVRMEQAAADLGDVLASLNEQIQAQAYVLDGAIWIRPQIPTASPTTTAPAAPSTFPASLLRPATEPVTPLATPPVAAAGPGLAGRVVVGSSVKTWGELADRLGAAAGFPCRINAPEGTGEPDFQATGRLDDILEAGRLLGLWAWQLGSEGPNNRPLLEIQVSLGP